MKNRLIKILILALIFLLPCINVDALTYQSSYVKVDSYKICNAWDTKNNCTNDGETTIKEVGNDGSSEAKASFKIGTNGGKKNNGVHHFGFMANNDYSFYLHQVTNGTDYVHTYCLYMGMAASESSCTKVKKLKLTAENINANNEDNKIGKTISDEQVDLLKKLLAHAYYIKTNLDFHSLTSWTRNDKTRYVYSKTDKDHIIATQILVWEIVESARTSFDKIEPNVVNSGKQAYKAFVERNDGVMSAYKAIIGSINDVKTAATPKAFQNTKTNILQWDGSKYFTKNLGSYGEYKDCTSNNNDVILEKSDGDLIVKTKNELTSDVTITCTYFVGDSKTEYNYYKFDKTDKDCDEKKIYQDLIEGRQNYTYKKTVKVKTAKQRVKIAKIDPAGNGVTGARFTLTLNSNTSYTYDMPNDSGKSYYLTKGGIYTLSETVTPRGKQKMPDAAISIDIEKGTANVISGGGGLIIIKNETAPDNGEAMIVIYVINTSKYFYINKTDQNGNGINGATFQIKNSSGALMRFNWDGTFVYNASGTITDVVLSDRSSYPISNLPDGEYFLVETAVPYPYILSGSESERTIRFKMNNGDMYLYSASSNNYLATASSYIAMKNYTTTVVVNKIGSGGVSLPGVSFYLLDSTKTNKIKSVDAGNGVYNYSIDQTQGTESYTTNANGQIVINALPAGTYYFEEYNTGETNYPIPTGEDAFTEVKIEVTAAGVTVNNSSSSYVTIMNAKNEFNFYKIDENGKYLTGGRFKIQKYNDKTKKYVDMSIKKVASTNSNYDTYEPDANGSTYTFTINNGVATFKELDSSARYKIVELEAPDGYEISNIKSDSELVVEVSSSGYVKSPTTLVNKSTSITEGAQASAELIINISTGQNRIRYILIISTLLIIIIGLFMINRKMRRK